jgi:hypothetical protein
LTILKVGDIVEASDDGQLVYGYVLGPDLTDPERFVRIRWFDGHNDTESDIKLIRKIINHGELDKA